MIAEYILWHTLHLTLGCMDRDTPLYEEDQYQYHLTPSLTWHDHNMGVALDTKERVIGEQ